MLVSQYCAFLDGRITELAYDLYAQADDGSVWYFGEDVFDGPGGSGGGDFAPPTSDCGSDDADETTLYRATGPDEAADIAENGFRPDTTGHGYQTGKLFALSLDDAVAFGESLARLGGEFTHIVQATVPSSFANESLKYKSNVDGKCAVFVDLDVLPLLNELAEIMVTRWP